MIEMERQASHTEDQSLDEDLILQSTLGKRSGYRKGMGDGIQVTCDGSYSFTTQESNDLKQKLNETQTELERANEKINTLSQSLAANDEKMAANDQKIDSLVAKLQEMRQFMLQLKANSSVNIIPW